MKNLSATVESLQTVHAAQEHFLALYAVECIWDQPNAYERLAKDLHSIDGTGENDCRFLSRRMDG